jgi:hypothetical protein
VGERCRRHLAARRVGGCPQGSQRTLVVLQAAVGSLEEPRFAEARAWGNPEKEDAEEKGDGGRRRLAEHAVLHADGAYVWVSWKPSPHLGQRSEKNRWRVSVSVSVIACCVHKGSSTSDTI